MEDIFDNTCLPYYITAQFHRKNFNNCPVFHLLQFSFISYMDYQCHLHFVLIQNVLLKKIIITMSKYFWAKSNFLCYLETGMTDTIEYRLLSVYSSTFTITIAFSKYSDSNRQQFFFKKAVFSLCLTFYWANFNLHTNIMTPRNCS